MASSKRTSRALFFHLLARSKRERRIGTLHHSHQRHPQRDLGRSAWHAWQDSIEERALASFESSSTPEFSLDIQSPWWIQVLTTDPNFLQVDERARCEMLLALPPKGSALPDWEAIVKRAIGLFEQKALHHKVKTQLHMVPSHFEGHEDAPLLTLCQGREIELMPAFSYDSARSWFSDDVRFDTRRVKRRAGSSPPPNFSNHFSSYAESLWLGGLSSKAGREPYFDDWVASIECLLQALQEHGAARALRCPGFFLNFPQAMDDPKLMERIDELCLDATRSRWMLDASTGPSGEHAKARSL